MSWGTENGDNGGLATALQPLDYAAYLRLPETTRRYDIIDGVLTYMSPSPNWDHQRTLREIFKALDRHVVRHRLGEVAFAPLDVIISKGPLRVRQPDVMFISNERRHVLRDFVHGGPDLVVEVISPGNTPRHIEQKLHDYAAADVREAWMADYRQRTIAVLHPDNGEFRETAMYRVGERLRSKVLPRLSVDVRRVFS